MENEKGYMEQLEGMMKMGLLGQADIEKMIKKATGGLWLDAEQQAQLETAMETYMGMIDSFQTQEQKVQRRRLVKLSAR